MTNSAALLTAEAVTFSYQQGKVALDQVSLTIPAGKNVALIGPNGAGKSTLFLHLNAILRPHTGRLLFKGQPYNYSRAAVTELRQKIGLVFQDHDTQLFAGSVLDDVLFGPMNLGLTLQEAEQRAMAALEAVAMREYSQEPSHFLSHGQKKRVAIAGILAMNPELMVMDEPTAGLDYPGMCLLSAILEQLHRSGKTLLVATHDMEWVWNWADLVYVIVQGHIVMNGTPQAVLTRSDHGALGFSQPILGQIYNLLLQHGKVAAVQNNYPRTVAELMELLV